MVLEAYDLAVARVSLHSGFADALPLVLASLSTNHVACVDLMMAVMLLAAQSSFVCRLILIVGPCFGRWW